jgi:hypothetical protein
MKVLVCGGRNFSDRDYLTKVLDRAHADFKITTVVHGDYRGADTLAKEWAKANNIQDEPYPADWDAYGLGAGPKRNQRMLDEGRPDLVISFPGGDGTADMIARTVAANVAFVPAAELLNDRPQRHRVSISNDGKITDEHE